MTVFFCSPPSIVFSLLFLFFKNIRVLFDALPELCGICEMRSCMKLTILCICTYYLNCYLILRNGSIQPNHCNTQKYLSTYDFWSLYFKCQIKFYFYIRILAYDVKSPITPIHIVYRNRLWHNKFKCCNVQFAPILIRYGTNISFHFGPIGCFTMFS